MSAINAVLASHTPSSSIGNVTSGTADSIESGILRAETSDWNRKSSLYAIRYSDREAKTARWPSSNETMHIAARSSAASVLVLRDVP